MSALETQWERRPPESLAPPTVDVVEFVIPGKPLTWQRARQRVGSGETTQTIYISPPDRKARMGEIRDAWGRRGVAPFERGSFLRLSCAFWFERPDSHFGTGRNAGVLKDSSRELRPTTGKNGGDLDNLVKLIKDALNKVAFHDDTQIVEYGLVFKDYVGWNEMASTSVRIERVKPRASSYTEQISLVVE